MSDPNPELSAENELFDAVLWTLGAIGWLWKNLPAACYCTICLWTYVYMLFPSPFSLDLGLVLIIAVGIAAAAFMSARAFQSGKWQVKIAVWAVLAGIFRFIAMTFSDSFIGAVSDFFFLLILVGLFVSTAWAFCQKGGEKERRYGTLNANPRR